MTQEEQIVFVRELFSNIESSIVRDIQTGKVPRSWNGMELRRLIDERAGQAAYIKMDKARLQAYNNHCLVNNM